MIDLHIGTILVIGSALLMMTVLPRFFAGRPLSLPLVYIAYGWVLFRFFDPLPSIDPVTSELHSAVLLYLTEVLVIVSLATVGLSLDRPLGWKSWKTVWLLLAIAMPVTVLIGGALGSVFLGLGAASAVLLGGVLAPTDPVLANEVQVPGPGDGHRSDEVRFALTAEAGLNDSLAFPVVHLAVALTTASMSDTWLSWISFDVAYRVLCGIAIGYAIGKLLARLATHRSGPARTGINTGLFILGATLLTYGLTEVLSGYGFLAVFVAALSRTDDEEFRIELHAFSEQVEAFLVALALIGVGALVAADIIEWSLVNLAIAGAFIFIVRPAAGLAALAPTGLSAPDRLRIAFFGIRGMGSIYYLAYATTNGAFDSNELATLWSVTTLVIIASTVIHGLSAPIAVTRETGENRIQNDQRELGHGM